MPWTDKNCSRIWEFFSVVILNTIWLNLKKQRDVNKQNSSSHLYTGTCKLGESNWISWLFLGPSWNRGTKTHNLPVWHWVPIRHNFCSMILPLVTGLMKMNISCHSTPKWIWPTCSHCLSISPSQLAGISQGTASFFLGSVAIFFPMQMATTFWKYIRDKKKCLIEEAGAWRMDSHLSFPPPLQNPIISLLISSLTIMWH